MIIKLLICFVCIIALFLIYQVYKWKTYLSPMHGMMIAMSLAMMVSLMIGITLAAKLATDPTLATIYMIVLGIGIGYIAGLPFGILAQLDGALAGIMGGLMGPMTGLMISNNEPNLFIGFFTLIYVFTTILVLQLIHKSLPIKEKTIHYTWWLFLPICTILSILAIFQSSTETLLHANPEKTSIQKKGFQEATIHVNSNGYSPSHLSLKTGIPVQLHFQRTSDSGCLSYLLIQDLGINQELKKGDNIISFTPKKPGTITFTCGMGMYSGYLSIK